MSKNMDIMNQEDPIRIKRIRLVTYVAGAIQGHYHSGNNEEGNSSKLDWIRYVHPFAYSLSDRSVGSALLKTMRWTSQINRKLLVVALDPILQFITHPGLKEKI